ncbi:hypothetical protein [Streptomyces sp. SudanB52_2052]
MPGPRRSAAPRIRIVRDLRVLVVAPARSPRCQRTPTVSPPA